jgi:hypothetical protein
MDLISLLVVLVVVGLVWYLITTYIPMAAPIRTVITVIAVLVLCLWLLSAFGIGHFHVGRFS